MNDYTKTALEFSKKHGVKLAILSESFDLYFPEDKQARSIFKCKLSRNGKSYTFKFGQSIMNAGIAPDLYDILSCMTKCDPYSFEDFCGEMGYSEDSRKAEKIYKAVCKEYKAMERLFGDCMEELQEIW